MCPECFMTKVKPAIEAIPRKDGGVVKFRECPTSDELDRENRYQAIRKIGEVKP